MLLKNGADANLVEYVCFILTLSLVFFVFAIFWCVLNKLKWYLFFQFGHTPLHLAAEKGNLSAVKALVRNPYSPADYSKQSKVSVSLWFFYCVA